MAGRTLTTDVLVLGKGLPADAFQPYVLLSAEHGNVRALQRLSRRSGSLAALDLFDEAEVQLEAPAQGQSWFVRESRVTTRLAGLGRNFETLRLASALANLASMNPVHEDGRASVYRLLRTAIAAFAENVRPDVVYLKSLYCFARDEGYPLKQQWFPELNAADRELAAALLNRPLSAQTARPEEVARLQSRLETYLRAHTEIVLP